jgi:hypothetical protein
LPQEFLDPLLFQWYERFQKIESRGGGGGKRRINGMTSRPMAGTTLNIKKMQGGQL